MDDELLGRQSAFDEAKSYGIIGDDNTVEKLRDLITAPPKTGIVLQAFAKANSSYAHWIEASIKFRQAVLREFERLVCKGLPVATSPEVEEREPGPSVEALAFAPA